MVGTTIPSRLRPLLDVLRRAYPNGVPRRDYTPLLEDLQWFMSERSLAIIVAALIDGDPAAVARDSAVRAVLPAGATGGMEKDIRRIRDRLDANGWDEAARDFDTRDLHARISPVPEQPDYMLDPLAVLRRAYPDGIPGAEYRALLAALHKEMSFRAIGEFVGAFTGRHYLAIYYEANGAVSSVPGDRAPQGDVDRVWIKLLGHGWIPEFPLPRYEQPGLAGQAITALQRAYPHGLTADDYLSLLAALNRDSDDGAGPGYSRIDYLVSEAFPGRNTVWHDAQVLHDADRASGPSPAEVERCWQHLLAHGFPPPGWPGEPGGR